MKKKNDKPSNSCNHKKFRFVVIIPSGHTFATRLVEEHVPLTTLMELMGHASVSTTQRYVTTLPEEKRKAVESMADYWNPEHLIQIRRLNGTKNRMRFEDVELPSWLQDVPVRGPRKVSQA